MPTAFKLQPLSLAQANPPEILECWQTLWNLNEVNAFCTVNIHNFCTVNIHNRIQMCFKYYRVVFCFFDWFPRMMKKCCYGPFLSTIWNKSDYYVPFWVGVSNLGYNWVAQRRDFKSALRVVKMVLNTQCYLYLWLTVWFHAKKSKETPKKSKSLILLM